MRRTRWFPAAGAALALGALAPAAAAAAGPTRLAALLDAEQEVPAPTLPPDARVGGTFTATVTAGRAPRIAYVLRSRTAQRALQAHIHLGAPRRAGPVAVTLCAPCRPTHAGTARITPRLRAALLRGTAYVNVHTARNPAGEIRGQIGLRVAARLTVGQEVPRPTGTRGGTGRLTGALAGRDLFFRLTFARLTGAPVAGHVHLGRRRVAGPIARGLCGAAEPCVSGLEGRVRLTVAQRRALVAGRTYVNLHTAANPAGEIRGQISAG